MELRLRAAGGGSGKIAWSTADDPSFPETRTVPFTLAPGTEWQSLTASVPVSGSVKTLRLHLPAQEQPVDLARIRFLPQEGDRPLRAWDFATAAGTKR